MIIKANVFYVQYAWEKEGVFAIYSLRMDKQNPAYQFVKEIDVEFDMPKEFAIKDAREEHLAAERAELKAKLAEVEKKMEALSC
jgi:hypothetical protein